MNGLDLGAYEYLNPVADSDHDLMCDGDELLAGTSPLDPLSNLRIEGLWLGPEAGRPAVFNWKTVTGRLYTVLSATNLNWPLTNPVSAEWTDVEGAGGALVHTNIDAAAQMFFRVRVARP